MTRFLVWIAALTMLAGWAHPVSARADAPADSIVGADEATNVAPPDLEALRREIGDGRVRIRLGQAFAEFRRVRLEPQGIAFEARDVREFGALGSPDTAASDAKPLLPVSPIAWASCDRIESARRSGCRGAGVGAVLGAIPMLIVVATIGEVEGFSTQPEATWFGAAVVGLGAASGAIVGAGLGALAHHWKTVWRRDLHIL